jgi:hypothetical protein
MPDVRLPESATVPVMTLLTFRQLKLPELRWSLRGGLCECELSVTDEAL